MKRRFGRAAAFAALAILSMMMLAIPQRATAQQNAESQPVKADQATSEQARAEPTRVDLGKAIFAEKCSHCHGPNMVNPGTITPDLRRFPDDHDRFVHTVKNGKNNRMPPWGDVLNDDDITDLWAYVSSRRNP